VERSKVDTYSGMRTLKTKFLGTISKCPNCGKRGFLTSETYVWNWKSPNGLRPVHGHFQAVKSRTTLLNDFPTTQQVYLRVVHVVKDFYVVEDGVRKRHRSTRKCWLGIYFEK